MPRITLDIIERASTQRRRRAETVEGLCKRLSHLNLTERRLTTLESMGACPNLQCIYLYDNLLTNVENLAFADKLTHVYLQHNRLANMKGINGLSQLRKLYLNGNMLTNIEGLSRLRELEELHVPAQKGATPLQFEDATLEALSGSLMVLNVSRNSLSSVRQFAVLGALEKLDASHNLLNSMEDLAAALGNMMRLCEVTLSGNALCRAPKYRDRVILMVPDAWMVDEKEVSQTERQFLSNLHARQQSRLLPPAVTEVETAAELANDTALYLGVAGGGMEEVHAHLLAMDGTEPPAAGMPELEPASAEGSPGAAGDPQPQAQGGEELAPSTDEFTGITQEIEERMQFLEQMRQAGQGEKYEDSVRQQLSAKLEELRRLDPTRADAAAQSIGLSVLLSVE